MQKEKILKYFKERNALLQGHFKLSSGLHSNKYFQAALLLQYPKLTHKLAKKLASFFLNYKIDTVIGPALGGVILAYEVARVLNAKALFAEREQGIMTLRREFDILPKEQILIVEDVVTTGNSVKEILKIVKKKKGKIVGIASLVNRAKKMPVFGIKYNTLIHLYIPTYSEKKCPLCKKGIPLVKPGSREK